MNEDTPADQIEWVDKKGKIYCSIFTFIEDDPNVKRMADLYRRRVVWKKNECNRYELLTELCLEIHQLVYHGDQQFEDGHTAIEHKCRKENKQKCMTFIGKNIAGKPKYRDEENNPKRKSQDPLSDLHNIYNEKFS